MALMIMSSFFQIIIVDKSTNIWIIEVIVNHIEVIFMLKMFRYLKGYQWIFVLLVIGFIFLQVQLDLMLPDYLKDIIDKISEGITTGNPITSDLLGIGGLMLLTVLGSVLSTVISSYFATRVATKAASSIRRDLYQKVQSFSTAEINKFSTPSLITRTTNDVLQVQMAMLFMLRMLVTAPIMAVTAIIKVTSINMTLTMIIVYVVSAVVVMVVTIFALVGKKFSLLQKQIDEVNQVTRETLTGVRVVRAHNAEHLQKDKFEKVNTKLTNTQIFVNSAMSFMNPGMMLAMNGLNLAVVVVSALLINQGLLGATPIAGLGILAQFTQYGMRILVSFMMLIMLFIFLPRAWVSARRINEVIKTKPSIDDRYADSSLIAPDQHLTIEFRDVCFKYPDAEECVLNHISFKANAGETLAFIGSTGSGKSTIIQLLLRFYDVTEGQILINDKDIKTYPLHELNKLMGYVPQQGILFAGDIESNMKIGNQDASLEDIDEAIESAQIKPFVDASESGIHHRIDQGGANVSGGQKQRLSIARALVKRPKIFVFDDSFSALDYRTDKKLRAALKTKTNDALKIIVGQRIGTILDAEQIIVLDNGNIVGIGTHHELMKNCQTYQEIAFAQLSKEELANV